MFQFSLKPGTCVKVQPGAFIPDGKHYDCILHVFTCLQQKINNSFPYKNLI